MANESDSKIGAFFSRIQERLQEQEWFQQLKAKWDELDPTNRFYIQVSTVAGSVLLILIIGLTVILRVHSLKTELESKIELRTQLQTASDELQRLRRNSRIGGGAGMDTSGYQARLKSIASGDGIDESLIEFQPEKPGATSATLHETLVEMKIKKFNIKQLIQFALQLENQAFFFFSPLN